MDSSNLTGNVMVRANRHMIENASLNILSRASEVGSPKKKTTLPPGRDETWARDPLVCYRQS